MINPNWSKSKIFLKGTLFKCTHSVKLLRVDMMGHFADVCFLT